MRTKDQLTELSARQAVGFMRAGELSAEAYADALLERCAEAAYLNAFITLEPQGVREAARAADTARAAGKTLGALHGLPIPIKDSVNTRDLPTTAGTPALRKFRPGDDAAIVERLKSAGALVLGKTNIHELSFGWTSDNQAFGAVRNPYDPMRIPGGSSGGTAAAVAARMAPLGVAEDTQGSIRVPAALSGVTGLRPTTGRYPNAGVAPITPLFDQVGPHARDVSDIVLFDQAVTGDVRPVAPAQLRGLRIGLVRDYYFSGLEAGLERVIEAALGALRAEGVVFVEVAAPGLAELISQVTGLVQVHDAGGALARYLKESGATVSVDELVAQASADVRGLWERFVLPGAPMAVSEAAYAAARNEHRPRLQRLFADLFQSQGLAALVLPATMVAATPIGQAEQVTIGDRTVPFQTAIARNISPGSTAGLPGLVLPAGLTSGLRLPVGIELDGPAGSDRTLLSIGLAVERAIGPIPPPRIEPGWRAPTP